MKRNLTNDEIEEILDTIFQDINPSKHLPNDTQPSLNLRISLKKDLKNITITPTLIPQLTNYLYNKYMTSRIDAGKSVGVICAQSIGEKQTQMTLNTFHAAGITVETVVTGVPRFLELLNASKEPKLSSTTLYLYSKDFKDKNNVKDFLYKNVLELKFSSFYTDFDIEDKNNFKPDWYPLFIKIFGSRKEQQIFSHQIFQGSQTFIKYKLNYDNLYRYRISPFEIAEKLCENIPDICCLVSPTDIGELHIYYSMNNDIPNDDDASDEESVNNEWGCIRNEIGMIQTLQNTILFGVKGIKDFFIVDSEEHYIVHTKGNNYLKLMGLEHINCDLSRSNNMWNIYSVLGIEATREFLIQEFSNIIASDGAYINTCHVSLLVDIMTFTGNIVSISRYGMKSDQFGALAKASFEESLDNFLKAAFFSEKERTSDVSAAIICGKRSNIGTGLCDIHLDISKML